MIASQGPFCFFGDLCPKDLISRCPGCQLGEIVGEYPDYAAARAKLVEAYLYQGLDFYSKGSLSAAIRVWRRALELEPGNEKLQRYIKKAETEIDQIR